MESSRDRQADTDRPTDRRHAWRAWERGKRTRFSQALQ